MTAEHIANNVCEANKPCADTQNFFAYRMSVRKKAEHKKPRKYLKFTAVIREAREALGKSQAEMSKILKLKSRQGFGNYENGVAMPAFLDLPNFCLELRLDPRRLIFPDGVPESIVLGTEPTKAGKTDGDGSPFFVDQERFEALDDAGRNQAIGELMVRLRDFEQREKVSRKHRKDQ